MTREEFLDAWASITGGLPNAEQLAIMDHAEGPLQIIAGPGVGKTYALTLRVCYLLSVRQVPPEAIVLTTFTRKAAEELRYRLQESISRLGTRFPQLRTLDLSRMHPGTLHSICHDILTETPASPFRHLKPLGALEQAFLIRDTTSFGKNTQDQESIELSQQLASWLGRSRPSRWQWVKLFTTAYERLIHDQIDRARFADASALQRKLMDYVEEYEAVLQRRCFTDQTLMQQQALELLNSAGGVMWKRKIQHVIVDEYQDFSVIGVCSLISKTS